MLIRVAMNLPSELLSRLDAFANERRWSRAAAALYLVESGLGAVPTIPAAPAGVRDLAPAQKTCEHHWGTERGESCLRCGGSRDIIRPGWRRGLAPIDVDAPEATDSAPDTNLDAFSPEVMAPKRGPQMGTLIGCRAGLHALRPSGHCRVCGIDPKNPPPPLPPEQANCKHDWQEVIDDGPPGWNHVCSRCQVSRDVARPGWRE